MNPVINRRAFLAASAGAATAAMLPVGAFAAAGAAGSAARKFSTTMDIELPTKGPAKAWLPLPREIDSGWVSGLDTSWASNADNIEHVEGGPGRAAMLKLEWQGGKTPTARVESTFTLRDRAATPGTAAQALSGEEHALYTSGSAAVPVEGIVRETALKIVDPASSPYEKVESIYQWMVVNTYRNGATRGCGEGDVAAMLASGDLGGKCADLNALFVALVRSVGVPARELYGVRVGPSRLGYKSLGANSETVTKAQHCRAEVFVDGRGWIAADPADVRKVMLEEPPRNLALTDEKVAAARSRLLGSWEGNWMPLNDARDVVLDGSQPKTVNFLMYPQAEIAGVYLDCLQADAFRYQMTAKEHSI